MQQDENSRAMAKEQILSTSASNSPVIPASLGERFSRFLVVIMEICLIYAILLVQAGFTGQASGTLLPLWAIFFLFLGFYWLAHSLQSFVNLKTGMPLSLQLRKTLARFARWFTVLVGLVFCSWLHFYAQSYALFDPAWFQAFANDAGQLNNIIQIVALAIILCAITWLSNLAVNEAEANGAVLLNKGGMFFAILTSLSLIESWFGHNPDFWQTFLFLLVFFWSGLTIQALQKASAKRRYHAVGLEGNTRHQEQIIFLVMLLFGLIVLGAALIIMHIHGVVLPLTSRMSDAPTLPSSTKPISTASSSAPNPGKPVPNLVVQGIFTHTLGVLLSIGAGILILGLIALSLFLWSAMRKKRVKKVRQDEVESIWNWSLFLAQLRALLRTQFREILLVVSSLIRPLRSKLRASGASGASKSQFSTSELHTIREIYQAFLHKAGQRGYQRTLAETPHEFHARLHIQEPLIDPELGVITEAYALARYGGNIPREGELAQIKEMWGNLDHKWE